MARSYNLKIKQSLLSFSLLFVTICSPAAEAFSLKKFLLAPVTIPLRYIGDVIFEIAECVYLKRTL
jgi:hypothetical protein